MELDATWTALPCFHDHTRRDTRGKCRRDPGPFDRRRSLCPSPKPWPSFYRRCTTPETSTSLPPVIPVNSMPFPVICSSFFQRVFCLTLPLIHCRAADAMTASTQVCRKAGADFKRRFSLRSTSRVVPAELGTYRRGFGCHRARHGQPDWNGETLCCWRVQSRTQRCIQEWRSNYRNKRNRTFGQMHSGRLVELCPKMMIACCIRH